jgi:hypothetical protein
MAPCPLSLPATKSMIMKFKLLYLPMIAFFSMVSFAQGQDLQLRKAYKEKAQLLTAKAAKVLKGWNWEQSERGLGFSTDADTILVYGGDSPIDLYRVHYEVIQGQKLPVEISYTDLESFDFSSEVTINYNNQNQIETLEVTLTEEGDTENFTTKLEYGYKGRVISISQEFDFEGFTVVFSEFVEISLDETERPVQLKKYTENIFGFLPPERQLDIEYSEIQYDSDNNPISFYSKEFFYEGEDLIDSLYQFHENLQWYGYSDQLLDNIWEGDINPNELTDLGASFVVPNDQSHLADWIGGATYVWEESEWLLVSNRIVGEVSSSSLGYSLVEDLLFTQNILYTFDEQGKVLSEERYTIPGPALPIYKTTYSYNEFDLMVERRVYFLEFETLILSNLEEYTYRITEGKLRDYTTTNVSYSSGGEEFRFEERYEYKYQTGTTSTTNRTQAVYTPVFIFPNPFDSQITIESKEAPTSRETWTLSDQQGREIYNWVQNPGQTQMQMNLEALAPGIYLLQNKSQPHAASSKLIKK